MKLQDKNLQDMKLQVKKIENAVFVVIL